MFRDRALPLQISHGKAKALRGSQPLGMGPQGRLMVKEVPRGYAQSDPSDIIHPALKKIQHIGRRRLAGTLRPAQWVDGLCGQRGK